MEHDSSAPQNEGRIPDRGKESSQEMMSEASAVDAEHRKNVGDELQSESTVEETSSVSHERKNGQVASRNVFIHQEKIPGISNRVTKISKTARSRKLILLA